MKILHGGHVVPQASLFDLKIRSHFKENEDTLAGELPRLWVRQISKFILAFHNAGLFNDISVQDVQASIQMWEKQSQAKLQRLAVIIRHIIDAANKAKNRKIEVRSGSNETLELHLAPSGAGLNALPEELAYQWVDKAAVHGGDVSDAIPGAGPGPASEYDSGFGYESDEETKKDYTACSAEDCGYAVAVRIDSVSDVGIGLVGVRGPVNSHGKDTAHL